jgi:hypothetical protein
LRAETPAAGRAAVYALPLSAPGASLQVPAGAVAAAALRLLGDARAQGGGRRVCLASLRAVAHASKQTRIQSKHAPPHAWAGRAASAVHGQQRRRASASKQLRIWRITKVHERLYRPNSRWSKALPSQSGNAERITGAAPARSRFGLAQPTGPSRCSVRRVNLAHVSVALSPHACRRYVTIRST